MTGKTANVGKLIFVVGPSGSGKDTLIDGAKDLLSDEKFAFIKREITRSAKAGGEDHIEISKGDFDKNVIYPVPLRLSPPNYPKNPQPPTHPSVVYPYDSPPQIPPKTL